MTARLTSATADFGDVWEWDARCRREGWTDGLPVMPPTEERVRAIVEHLGREPEEVIGVVPPVRGVATVEQVAIQCAMAGCLPEHVPVVIAALEAMLDPSFNLHGVQCTTNPCAPLTIVSGPIARRLAFNARHGAFGGGAHANAAVGRAVRLVLWNIGGGRPGVNDMSPLGQPAKYAFAVAENVEQSPWPEFHTARGFDAGEDVVTVFACQSPYPAILTGTTDRILATLCEGFAGTTQLAYHAAGEYLVVLSIKPAVALAAAGYTREDVRRHLWENGRLSVGHLRYWRAFDGALDHISQYWGDPGLAADRPASLEALDDSVRLPTVRAEEDIHILVTGGDGQWFGGYCPGWGNYGGRAISRRIETP